MARGDVHWFTSFDLKAKSGVSFNLPTDVLKLAIVDNAVVPTASTADPRFGAGGSVDFSAHEVAHATAYTGPITLTSTGWTRSGAVNSLAAANPVVAQDAAGFTNGYYGIIYDDTVAGKYALGFGDLGGYEIGNIKKGTPSQNSRTAANAGLTRKTASLGTQLQARLDAMMLAASADDELEMTDDERDLARLGMQSSNDYRYRYMANK
jgi:hypothetical protein